MSKYCFYLTISSNKNQQVLIVQYTVQVECSTSTINVTLTYKTIISCFKPRAKKSWVGRAIAWIISLYFYNTEVISQIYLRVLPDMYKMTFCFQLSRSF